MQRRSYDELESDWESAMDRVEELEGELGNIKPRRRDKVELYRGTVHGPKIQAEYKKSHPANWSFHCDHCNRRHFHSKEAGHRIAHCHDDSSPYADNGYFLIPPVK